MHPTKTPTKDQIKQRALDLWEKRGRPEGHDAEFWSQAERELSLGENPTAVTANAQGGSGSGSDGPSNA